MKHFEPEHHEEAAEHYRAAGYAIAGLGVVGVLVGSALLVGGLAPDIVDGPSMLFSGASFVALGAAMVLSNPRGSNSGDAR